MIEIKAFIQHEALETVIQQLEKAGAKDITAIKVDALGDLADFERDRAHVFRKYNETYSKVIKLEIVCKDSNEDPFIEIIKQCSHFGEKCDGRIFVTILKRAINIDTGEEGDQAL